MLDCIGHSCFSLTMNNCAARDLRLLGLNCHNLAFIDLPSPIRSSVWMCQEVGRKEIHWSGDSFGSQLLSLAMLWLLTQAFEDRFPPLLASKFSHDLLIQLVNKVRKSPLFCHSFSCCLQDLWVHLYLLPDRRFPCTRVGAGCIWITHHLWQNSLESWPGVRSIHSLANSDT